MFIITYQIVGCLTMGTTVEIIAMKSQGLINVINSVQCTACLRNIQNVGSHSIRNMTQVPYKEQHDVIFIASLIKIESGILKSMWGKGGGIHRHRDSMVFS
jgi:hypothetical protein